MMTLKYGDEINNINKLIKWKLLRLRQVTFEAFLWLGTTVKMLTTMVGQQQKTLKKKALAKMS